MEEEPITSFRAASEDAATSSSHLEQPVEQVARQQRFERTGDGRAAARARLGRASLNQAVLEMSSYLKPPEAA